MVRGPGAAASPLLTVASSSPRSSGAQAASSSSPTPLVLRLPPSAPNRLASSADPALSPHLEYQAVVLRDVKPGERVYATVSGAGGAGVGAVAPASSWPLPDRREEDGGGGGGGRRGGGGGREELPRMLDNDDDVDADEAREEGRRRRQKQQQQQQQRGLPSNTLVSSAADLLFGPSALAAATARGAKAPDASRPSPASPPLSAASVLFASSAALSEPDASRPAYRLRATWAPAPSEGGPETLFLCPADCSGSGRCVADGECSCAPGAGGWRCQGRALDVSPGRGAAGALPVGGWAFFRLPRSPREGLTVRLDARGGGRPLLLARAGGAVAGPGAPDAPPAASQGRQPPPPPLTLQVASGTQLLRVSPEDSSAEGGVVLALYNAPAGTHFAGSPLVFAVAVAGSASDAAAAALLGGGSNSQGKSRFPSARGLGGLGPWAAVSVALAATALCAGLILIARAGVLLAHRRRAAAAMAAAAATDAETAAAAAAAATGGGGAATAAALGRPAGPGLSDEAIAALPTRRWEGAAAEKARRASSTGGLGEGGGGGGNGSAASVVHIVATAATASAPPLSPSVSPSQMPKQQQAQHTQQQQRLEADEKENAAADLDGEDDSGICCVVCCCEFSRGEELRILLPCRHEFHSSCVDAWLRGHASCPVCRSVPSGGGGSGGGGGGTGAAGANEGAEVARSPSPPPPRPPTSPPPPDPAQ